jgi:hypothetical protein
MQILVRSRHRRSVVSAIWSPSLMMIRQQVSRALAALPRLRKETLRWAVGEISIVVTGVLIAFALNAWWVERDALRAEQVHLRSLVTDFEQNVGSLQALLKRQERVEKACVDLLRLARTEPVASSDSVRPLLGQVFSSVRFEPGSQRPPRRTASQTLARLPSHDFAIDRNRAVSV